MTKGQLLPPEIRRALPSFDEEPEELIATAKFFYPDFGWTWYACAFDGNDLFFGLVVGFETELGYFRLSELLENRGQLGCSIERDLYFTPTPVNALIAAANSQVGMLPSA